RVRLVVAHRVPRVRRLRARGSRAAEAARRSVALRRYLREDAERRLADRQLVELRVHAAEFVDAAAVARVDARRAHRQGMTCRLHRTEAAARALGRDEKVDVDLDFEDVLHAADVAMPELVDRVEERTALRDARRRVDDLVAMNVASPALDLVLRTEGELDDVDAGVHQV